MRTGCRPPTPPGTIDAAEGQELVTEEIECSICTRLALGDPVKTHCEHVFHRECLDQALAVRRNCPNCRAEIPGNAVFAPPDRLVRNMMGRLLVNCPQQCGARPMRFDSLAGHIESGGDCPATPIRCTNDGCGAVTERRNAGQHHAVCPHRKEPCPKCKAEVHHRDLQNHVTNQCENRQVPCQHCREQIVLSKRQEHLREECTAPVPMKLFVQLQERQERLEAMLQQGFPDRAPPGLALLAPRTLCTAVQPPAATKCQHGLFFDLQSKARPVAVSALWIAHDQPAEHDWSVWTRAAAGTYRDQLGRGGWEKLCDGSDAGQKDELHRCPFGRAVTVAAGGTQAFYVHCSGNVVFAGTDAQGYAPSADDAVALRPGTFSSSVTAFDSISEEFHGLRDFVGRVEYRVTE